MTFYELAIGPFAHFNVGEKAIRHCLELRGYKRRVALSKPPLTEKHKEDRLRWAIEHANWSFEQWCAILWSDETWVSGGRHTKTYVTRKKGEAYNETCLVDKVQKKRGWMFWASFSGTTKGPHLFWEKDWGSINQERYCERILPLVHGWLRINPHLFYMQDNAKAHAARATIQECEERGFRPIWWPANSPDLNPIETIWNKMKDWIAWNYPDKPFGKQYSYEELRKITQEAWMAISEETLKKVIEEMPLRCQAVIDAHGGYTKY
jgi:ketohexokinase/beta-glucosidase